MREILTSSHLHLPPCCPQEGAGRREGHQPRGMLRCPPDRNGTSTLLFPSLGLWAASSSGPRALPVSLCSCGRCPAQLLHGGGCLSLRSKAHGTGSQRPLSSGSSCGTAATPGWPETRTARGSRWKPLARCPRAVTAAPLARLRGGPGAPGRGPGVGGGKANCRWEFVEKNLTAWSSNFAAFDGSVQKIYCSRR